MDSGDLILNILNAKIRIIKDSIQIDFNFKDGEQLWKYIRRNNGNRKNGKPTQISKYLKGGYIKLDIFE